MARAWVTVIVLLGSVADASADPVIGTSVSAGRPMAGGDTAHGAMSLYALGTVGDSLTVGGELSGSLEGYTGDWGCGLNVAFDGEPIPPSLAVTCLQPTVGAHGLVGSHRLLSNTWSLRVEGGLGATAVFLIPGEGADSDASLLPSALARVQVMWHVGELLGGHWRTGMQIQERALGVSDTRFAGSLGLVLEATARD